MNPDAVEKLMSAARVVVCVGPGGVGKTTVSALLALHAHGKGRRTLCATVDPSERLAESLGVRRFRRPADFGAPPGEAPRASGLEDRIVKVEEGLEAVMVHGSWLVERAMDKYIPAEKREESSRGSFYSYLKRTLRGLHELAGMDLVADLIAMDRWDTVIVDTAPSAHAIDFLETPQRIISALRSPALGLFMSVSSIALPGRRIFDRASALILRAVGKMVGMDFMEELSRFLSLNREGLERLSLAAEGMKTILRDGRAGIVQVTTPEAQQVDESIYLHERIRQEGLATRIFFINRMLPCLLAGGQEEPPGGIDGEGEALREKLRGNLAAMSRVAALEEKEVLRLRGAAAGAPAYVRIPFLEEDVVDLPVLRRLLGKMETLDP